MNKALVSVYQDLSATTKSASPPAPLPKGEGRQDTPSPIGRGLG